MENIFNGRYALYNKLTGDFVQHVTYGLMGVHLETQVTDVRWTFDQNVAMFWPSYSEALNALHDLINHGYGENVDVYKL